eukprot:GHVS01103317.1.p1 GENE.GHVS01103317.1~~GHVS01103317.1.p1  ORF type:complete len:247 (-),score=26.02 GHVS01103317.1:197-937(-)
MLAPQTLQGTFPVVRITSVGSTGCGKTSLTNCFINNTIVPHIYQPTQYSGLFYRVWRLPPEEDEKGIIQSVVVEVEDTPGTNSCTTASARSLFNMTRTTHKVAGAKPDFTPFVFAQPPAVQHGPKQTFIPVTRGRMGYLIVFDALNNKSFDEALNLHDLLNEELQRRNERLKPVVFLVATKIDKNPESQILQSIVSQAETYSQKMRMRLWKVSAVDGKNVKRVSRRTYTTCAHMCNYNICSKICCD